MRATSEVKGRILEISDNFGMRSTTRAKAGTGWLRMVSMRDILVRLL
jgi:hypothetical protein